MCSTLLVIRHYRHTPRTFDQQVGLPAMISIQNGSESIGTHAIFLSMQQLSVAHAICELFNGGVILTWRLSRDFIRELLN